MRTTVEESPTGEAADDASGRPWCVSIAHHPRVELIGTTVMLHDGEPLLLGRDATAFGAGALDDARLSREHARIRFDGGPGPVVEDAGSTNRTYVNGKPVEHALLRDGDVVGVGPLLILAHRAEPSPDESSPRACPRLVGVSQQHHALVGEIRSRASRSGPIVVLGETGVGKTAVARAIHDVSARSGALQMLDCRVDLGAGLQSQLFGQVRGAFPGADEDRGGILEAAHEGTLLLDAVSDTSPNLQKALERFLDSGEVQRVGAAEPTRVDARVIATTTTPAHRLVTDGILRAEFASRLGRATITVPPLRRRLLDVPVLAAHFVERYSGERRPLHRKLVLALLLHSWFGNVRELETIIEAAVMDSDAAPLRLTPLVSTLLREGRKTRVTRALEDDEAAPLSAPATILARSGAWFEREGEDRVRLDRRPSLSLILAGLVERMEQDPGSPLSVSQLLALGWPGEEVLEPAGSNRVYVAVTSLRKLGLKDVIRRSKLGYWLDPEARVEIATS